MQIDGFDAKILDILQINNLLSSEQIGERVGLSPSAVQRRVRRLRKEGIIESDVSIVSPEGIGRRLMVIIEVTLEREHATVLEDFGKLMLSTPEVMQCYYVTGDADFILIATVRDMQDYELFAKRFFSDNIHVKRFNSSMVIKRVKTGLVLPVGISIE